MNDDKTDSLWSHLQGEAMTGELKGTKLKTFPSVVVDWGTWKKQYPETTAILIDRRADNFTVDVYGQDLTRFVVGVLEDGKAKAWNYADIVDLGVVNDSFGEKSVVVFINATSKATTVFERTLGDSTLVFRRDGNQFVDEETGSRWDFLSGKCVDGKHQGKQLRMLTSIPSLAKAWQDYYPDSEYYAPN